MTSLGDRIYKIFSDCYPEAVHGWPDLDDFSTIERFREAMASHFRIAVMREGKVALRLPKGRTRTQMLQALLYLYGSYHFVDYEGENRPYYDFIFTGAPCNAWLIDALKMLP